MRNMNTLPLLVQKLWPGLMFSVSRSNSRSRSPGHKSWYDMKGLATMNAHVKHNSPTSSG